MIRKDDMRATKLTRVLFFFSVFRFFWLGFCVFFILVAVAFFAVSVYGYLTPGSTLFGAELNVPLSFVLVSLAMVFACTMMFILGRSIFRRVQAGLDGTTHGNTEEKNEQKFEWNS